MNQNIRVFGGFRFRFQAGSDTGLVRSINEDSLVVSPDHGLFAVCDGLGGHAAGEVASSLAATTLQEAFEQSDGSLGERLRKGLHQANTRILSDQQEQPRHRGMGTTVSMLALSDGETEAWIGHVGDSRIYRQREGSLEQLTRDHSPVFQLYLQGQINKDEMRHHPQKSLIEKALGLSRLVEPDIFVCDVRSRDLFLLCTDGLSDVLSDEDIIRVFESRPWEEFGLSLLNESKARGGFDNISLIILEIV